ncbi:MAG: DUF2945 domain-containing protein [Aphanocapsa lilacina HA4352-LM1]|jgi:hypothetical protein|nr:DUF2945 domain-containing protein [Aphanocapsa lilacina HA4352-LM1]
MAEELKVGDRVEWHRSGGKSTGEIQKKLTEPIEIKGHKVAASTDNPQFLVVSDKSGEEAAHKPEALKKISEKPRA